MDTLYDKVINNIDKFIASLNPCSDGYTLRLDEFRRVRMYKEVLILVLMDTLYDQLQDFFVNKPHLS